jgi:capping protein beta
MAFADPSTAAHDLLRHVPPRDVEPRMYDLISLNNDLLDDLLSTVDIPFKVAVDLSNSRKYVICDYNRDGDSWRSPFSNQYDPPVEDGVYPPPNLRRLEEVGNKLFDVYLNQYFGEGVLSCYCWELDDSIFGIGVFIQRDVHDQMRDGSAIEGSVSCSHVVEVTKNDDKFDYSMISSILLDFQVQTGLHEPLRLSGSVAQKREATLPAENELTHLRNVGVIIEESSAGFMDKVRSIYVEKMKEILSYVKPHALVSLEGHRHSSFH